MLTTQERGVTDFYAPLKARGSAIEQRYRALTPRSIDAFRRAADVFPGGYTRDALIRDPHPTFIASAGGTRMTDIDGRVLTDFWFNATSLALGHAHPAVVAAIAAQVPRGTAYYAPTEIEVEHARALLPRIPGAARIRFTNSGSEAVMMALRFARAFTRRVEVVKFEGSYHGSYDDVSWSVSPKLAEVGAHDAPVAVAETAGLAGASGRVAVLPFNDPAVLRAYVEQHHASIAAILVEPMANRIGLLMPERAFLAEARALCDRFGIVLVFDEVIAFRVGYRGAAGEMGVTPDLTALGKIIGGGFAVGAVAGGAEILELSALHGGGRVTHAGTFNGNPVMSVAGRATMEALTPETFARLATLGEHARAGLAKAVHGLPLQITGAGSLFKVTATAKRIHDYRDAATADKRWESLCSLALLNEGFVLTPTLSGCISAVTTRDEVDALVAAFTRIVNG
ncbi:MAG: aminotransferase class III-fold pyridoxal phosphate-dependent enzyme [Burkholderiales bacterium]|nr:aminotransferase class III-fold pyridoxal phosphate-dependent enzyme [Burkholderiales bacterium]